MKHRSIYSVRASDVEEDQKEKEKRKAGEPLDILGFRARMRNRVDRIVRAQDRKRRT